MPRTVVVIPCFNEAKRFQGDALVDFVQERPETGFVLVDDGSTDGTQAVLEAVAQRVPDNVQVVVLDRNRGKAEAVRRGVRIAADMEPAYVGYWDADLATPLAAIPEFEGILEQDEGLLLVMGARIQLLGRSIRRSAARHYLGRMFATAASRLLCLPVYDTQCGAKLFRARPALLALFDQPWRTRWLFDVELLARLSESAEAREGRPTTEVLYEQPLSQWHDIAGSKVRAGDFVKAIGALWRLWWAHHGKCKRANRRAR